LRAQWCSLWRAWRVRAQNRRRRLGPGTVPLVGLIAEDLLLLLLDDSTGKAMVDSTALDRVLAGAVLLELALDHRIAPAGEGESIKKGRLAVRNADPTRDELLDRVLSRLAEDRPRKPEGAIEKLSGGLRKELLTRLAARGLVRPEVERALGLFPVTRWPVVDPAYESGLRAELTRVLVDGAEPAPRTAALVSLLAAVEAAAKVVPSADRRAVKRRAKELARGEWAGAAVRQAVDAVNGAVAASIVAVTVATGSGS